MNSVKCNACRRVIFKRRGNTLIAYGFSLEMKRSHNIECECGKGSAMFCISREKIVVAKNQEKN